MRLEPQLESIIGMEPTRFFLTSEAHKRSHIAWLSVSILLSAPAIIFLLPTRDFAYAFESALYVEVNKK